MAAPATEEEKKQKGLSEYRRKLLEKKELQTKIKSRNSKFYY